MENLGRSFKIDDVQYDYPLLLRWLRDGGFEVSPRGQKTREVMDVVMELDPHYAIVEGINRKLSMKLISMEALQLITCLSYPERTVKAAPNMSRYMNGGSFHGAYGVRMGAQLEGAINRLKQDHDTRQALITIWDPVLDMFHGTQPRDMPCTTVLQFFVRDYKLVLHVTMRSNDAWWGTPHDWGQFSQLQLAMAHVIGLEAGAYYHHAVSFHLYERDFEKIDQLTAPTKPLTYHVGLGWKDIELPFLKKRATSFIEEAGTVAADNVTEQWHKNMQMMIDNMVTAS